MELFERKIDPTKNLLPFGGTVNYYGKIFDQKRANEFLSILMQTIEWKNDEAIIFGKKS
ncbi:hypothetical protein [Cyclobacterium qasimii]|uniref:DNA repair system specific for alkylated DNA n=1 Tax=Cyclobacterium qasimii M12-11B TaxID=641524 RepID=S7VPT1_9BACT|nr:hypothetical protein [Cyclobacterium qasimii]EPR71352.1 DNA repair system specific for alkylated DNA [Cyclobacterium qasimii M12-11B]